MLEAWELNEALLNQTDIEAIKHLLLENQIQQDNFKCANEEIKKLKEKINTYENPEDLTLMFMYCEEKAKDKIKQLKEVIEEVRELRDQFIDENELSVWENDSLINFVNKLLQILDKGVKNE